MSARPGQLVGQKNGNWRGGRVIDPRGYVLIRVGLGHPLADVRGYAYEHRLVAARTVSVEGRHVHHDDEDHGNNSASNLEPLTPHQHRAKHRKRPDDGYLRNPGEDNPTIECACGCGDRFSRFDASGRRREYVSGHNPPRASTQELVLSALAAGPKHRSDLSAMGGTSVQAIASCLSKLKGCGKVVDIGGGRWSLTDG